MFKKDYTIEDVEDLKLKVEVVLNIFKITVKEKMGLVWTVVFEKQFKITVDSYDFQDHIEKTLNEYLDMKSVENHVTNELNVENSDIISFTRED